MLLEVFSSLNVSVISMSSMNSCILQYFFSVVSFPSRRPIYSSCRSHILRSALAFWVLLQPFLRWRTGRDNCTQQAEYGKLWIYTAANFYTLFHFPCTYSYFHILIINIWFPFLTMSIRMTFSTTIARSQSLFNWGQFCPSFVCNNNIFNFCDIKMHLPKSLMDISAGASHLYNINQISL